ncbi:MAG: hypothetical protein MUE44_00900 [Oscillatoriaceae cyanobacterium Prado104]|nr:hypothetical protein [Oscillatoriaceae cyanobacterium Prado104]
MQADIVCFDKDMLLFGFQRFHRKKEEGRRKKEEGRRKKEEGLSYP